MYTKLVEIAKLNGLTIKQLATNANIKYTTLISLSKREVTSWNKTYVNSMALALNMKSADLKRQLAHPVSMPFIKWVGGKRQLLPELIKYIPPMFGTYFEPFVGGGALLFRLSPTNAVINDFNAELTNAYKVVRDSPTELINLLHYHKDHDSKDYYLDIRAADRDGRIVKMTSSERAARFIYLNKSGFNGLWRVNAKGQNNVPYGAHKKLNLVPDSLKADSNYLNTNNIDIKTGDYKEALLSAKKGDFVYLDPPYIPINPTSNFTSYTKLGFGLVQQEELRDLAHYLASKEVKVMLSNSDTKITRDLYRSSIFKLHEVSATRSINSNGSKRGKTGELIITTY